MTQNKTRATRINARFLFSFSALFFVMIAINITTTPRIVLAQDAQTSKPTHENRKSKSVRFATFNVSMNRPRPGALTKELKSGTSKQVSKIAAIIQTVRPDVILLNEIDFDGGESLKFFEENFLAKSQFGQKPIHYRHRYVGPVNTGVDSRADIDKNGKKGEPNDAFGYGLFPGQYGMAVLSRHPIDTSKVRTFQKFLWKDMPDALLPKKPVSNEPWYSTETLNLLRLSSKSHWDVPIKLGSQTVHFLTSHPTPPVFDGKEDRNGKRNHDEIRMWADYVGVNNDYLYDDNGTKGGLANDQAFIIAGDLNADPIDGDSTDHAATQLIDHPRVVGDLVPSSEGGAYYAKEDGGVNIKQKGNPSHDTANFNDHNVGNVRIDYVLPSNDLKVCNQGIFWPKPEQPGHDWSLASDHRMVWIDIETKSTNRTNK